MAERASLHGGQLEAGPSDDGYTVHLRLPLSADELAAPAAKEN
jgi:hypothetical protein